MGARGLSLPALGAQPPGLPGTDAPWASGQRGQAGAGAWNLSCGSLDSQVGCGGSQSQCWALGSKGLISLPPPAQAQLLCWFDFWEEQGDDDSNAGRAPPSPLMGGALTKPFGWPWTLRGESVVPVTMSLMMVPTHPECLRVACPGPSCTVTRAPVYGLGPRGGAHCPWEASLLLCAQEPEEPAHQLHVPWATPTPLTHQTTAVLWAPPRGGWNPGTQGT